MSGEHWRLQAAADDATRAAQQLESAAQAANAAASRMEDACHKLSMLLGSGYGNNVELLIELLQKSPAPSSAQKGGGQ